VTPAQLRAFAAVVRLGSVKAAAAELEVSDAAVSLHIGQLRRELDDQLFTRTASGPAFTPGGLRLARRATEMLGLADRTVREVSQAGKGRRTLALAASTLFAEHAAPGLIAIFTARAKDLDVEMSVRRPGQFVELLTSRVVDLAVGVRPADYPETMLSTAFLTYQVVVVAAPDHPAAAGAVDAAGLRDQTWLLGPAAAGDDGLVPRLLRRLDVPEARQRIFQSSAAAREEAKRGNGVMPSVAFAVTDDLAQRRLVRVTQLPAMDGTWYVMSLPDVATMPAAAELSRFVATPRAMQAMIKGAGVTVGHFRPAVHVTLWS